MDDSYGFGQTVEAAAAEQKYWFQTVRRPNGFDDEKWDAYVEHYMHGLWADDGLVIIGTTCNKDVVSFVLEADTSDEVTS